MISILLFNTVLFINFADDKNLLVVEKLLKQLNKKVCRDLKLTVE